MRKRVTGKNRGKREKIEKLEKQEKIWEKTGKHRKTGGNREKN